MPDFFVPHIVLDEPGIGTSVRQEVACRMAQHVGVNVQAQARLIPRTRDNVGGRPFGDWRPALTHEDPPRLGRLLGPEPPERPQLVPLDGVGGGLPALLAPDVERRRGEVHGLPFEEHRLSDAECVPIHGENQGIPTV